MSLFQSPFLSPSSPSISHQSTLLRLTLFLIILFETVHFGFDLFHSPQTHHTLLLFRFLFTLASTVFSNALYKPTEATKSKIMSQYPTVSLLKILTLFLEFYCAIELCSPETLYMANKDTVSHILLEGTWRLFLWDQISPKRFIESHHLLLTIYLFCLGICYNQPFLFTLRVISQAFALLYFFGNSKQIERINHGKNPNHLEEEINNIQDIKLLSDVLNYLPEGLIIINSKSQIKFFNKTVQDILKLHDNFSFNDLNQNIFNLKFSNFLGNSEESLSPDGLHDTGVGYAKTSAEQFRNSQSLQDLVNLYMTHNTEFSLENSTVFTAKRNDQHNLELQFHYINGPNEKFLLGLIKDSTIFEQKTLLLEKEKLHYRDNLVSSFSHELKTPLNSTLGFLEQAMESSLIPNEVKQRLIKPALSSGKLLFLLVSDILDYSLILSNQIQLKITPRNPRDTVNHCLELVKLKATQKGLKITLDIEENDLPEVVNTDHKRLAQVLINLLNNSIQYTFKGNITISMSQSSENSLLISVQDTGIGMNRTTKQRVTNSLVQNELEGGSPGDSMGIGLGLFISNKLAKMLNPDSHKGLGFISEKETGSTFYFEIKDHQMKKKRLNQNFEDLSPRRIISGYELEPKTSLNVKIRQYNTRRIKNTFAESSKGEILNRPKVLIVDDEIFNITILENICKNCGVSTEKALNGQEALEKLNQGKYSLIFMDINMPVLDGYQATRKIGEMIKKGEMEDVTIIGVTAYVGWNKIEEGYKSGMTEILSKPVSKEVIKNILRKYKLI